MVERYRRRKRKEKLLGNHQKCWIWGRHVVTETLRAGRWPILELVVDGALPPPELESVRELAAKRHISLKLDSSEALHSYSKSREHQGYLAKMSPFPYAAAPEFFETLPPCPLLAMLDAVQDPYNFGAMLRSGAALGVHGFFVSKHRQAEVTSLVARASAGGVNLVPIVQVDDLCRCAVDLQQRGIRLVGTSQSAEQAVCDYHFSVPTAVLIGNEGAGIRPELLERCDAVVSIPQQGTIDSLNAAVSAGILFYEAQRQRMAVTISPRKDDVGARTS